MAGPFFFYCVCSGWGYYCLGLGIFEEAARDR